MTVWSDDELPGSAGQGLVAEIGRPRSAWTVDDLVNVVRSRNVRVLSLMHVGGDGWLKTLDFVPSGERHLRDIIGGGERADGSSLFRGLGIPSDACDIVLRPRIETAFLDPFAPLPTLAVLCGHLGRDGAPLPQAPDTIVRRAATLLRNEAGIDLWALSEVEYFLGKRWDENDIYGADDRGYHATSPFVFGGGLRRRALAILADLGVGVKYGHAEVGYIEARETQGVIWEQHEIELALQPLLAAADGTLLTQWVLRNLAHQSGMRCTMDPMMREGHAGNGLHFHIVPVSNGEPLAILNADGTLTDPARWLIGGLVQLSGALMAFGNRVRGSFARLRQAKEAPNTIVWGEFDRSALIRIPVVARDTEGREVTTPTIEFRLPDGSALPHLVLAGAALATVQGRVTANLDDLLTRTKVGGRDGSSAAEPVPRSFAEVADAMERCRSMLERGETFPAAMVDSILAGLRSPG
ncbi:MAG: glutamine synthetase [Gemmatimonadales bacterium]|nr:glutamine synthetase [Gemmatimonadales bacterium]